MPKKISNETITKAQELRTQGKSYAYISNELDVSISWCRHNLVSAQEKTKEVVAELENKSRTKKGVSKGEIAKAVDVAQSKEQLKKDVQKVTQRLRKRSKENIVRPNWMMPEFSVFITNNIVQESMAAEQRLNDQAYELHCLLVDHCTTEEQRDDVPSVFALKGAIATLVYTMTNQSSKAGGILENWLESLYNTAVKLENRNTKNEVLAKPVPFVLPSELQGMDDIAY